MDHIWTVRVASDLCVGRGNRDRRHVFAAGETSHHCGSKSSRKWDNNSDLLGLAHGPVLGRKHVRFVRAR